MAVTPNAQGWRLTAADDEATPRKLSDMIGMASRSGGVVVSGSITAGSVTVQVQTMQMFARDSDDFVPVEGGTFAAGETVARAIDLVGSLNVRAIASSDFAGDAYVELT